MDRREALKVRDRCETAHLALAVAGRLMRHFDAIVRIRGCAVQDRRDQGTAGGVIARQLVGDQGCCCVNRNWPRALPRVGSSPIDRARLWSTKPGHSIEHVARKHRFDSLRCASPTSKSIAENRLVPEERVLDAGLSMIAALLLPSTAPNLADPSDRPIASARPRVASGQRGCLRRRHDDGRASGVGCLVEGERVVGRVRRDRPRAAGHGLDQIEARTRVIHRGIGQRLSDDHSRLVDSQMKLLPPPPPASSVFRRRPLTLADHRQASAGDEEVQGGAPGNASECEVEMLPAPGQRRVVGRPQVKAHQMEE